MAPEAPAEEAAQAETPAQEAAPENGDRTMDDATLSGQGEEMSPEARQAEEAAKNETAPARGVLEKLPNGREHVLVVRTLKDQRSWMEIEEDDNPSRELTLNSGQRLILKFKKRLRIRLGNGGGVAATLDGKDYPIDADKGQVRTLIFE